LYAPAATLAHPDGIWNLDVLREALSRLLHHD
jgi:hypothetical protein